MECTFSPALVAKTVTATTATTAADRSAFACLPSADDGSSAGAGVGAGGAGSGGRGREPVHERLYNMRGRTEVKNQNKLKLRNTAHPSYLDIHSTLPRWQPG